MVRCIEQAMNTDADHGMVQNNSEGCNKHVIVIGHLFKRELIV